MNVIEYFNFVVDVVSEVTDIDINVYVRKSTEKPTLLGKCIRFLDWDRNVVNQYIEIDIDYIIACYHGDDVRYSPYSIYHLLDTVCHEFAHTVCWEHGYQHTQLTNHFYQKAVAYMQDMMYDIDVVKGKRN